MESSKSSCDARDTKDVVIGQLRRELAELRKAQDTHNELQARVDSLEHLNLMVSEEKRRAEAEAADRHKEQSRVISELRSALEAVEARAAEYEYETRNLQQQNDWFEQSLAEQKAETDALQAAQEQAEGRIEALSEESKALRKDLRDQEIEKEELEKQVARQNLYIEELVAAVKERDGALEEAQEEKGALEDEQGALRKEHEQQSIDLAAANENLELLRRRLEVGATERNELDEDLEGARRELNAAEEEARLTKKKMESVKEVYGELELDLRRREREVESLTLELGEARERLEATKRERAELGLKLGQTRTENEKVRRELQKAAIDQQDIISELKVFDGLNGSIGSCLSKKAALREQKDEANRELKKALDSLHTAFLGGKTSFRELSNLASGRSGRLAF